MNQDFRWPLFSSALTEWYSMTWFVIVRPISWPFPVYLLLCCLDVRSCCGHVHKCSKVMIILKFSGLNSWESQSSCEQLSLNEFDILNIFGTSHAGLLSCIFSFGFCRGVVVFCSTVKVPLQHKHFWLWSHFTLSHQSRNKHLFPFFFLFCIRGGAETTTSSKWPHRNTPSEYF